LSEDQLKIVTQAVTYFKYFDKDMDGTIDGEEAKALHADLVKNKMTTFDLAQTIEDLDSDGDGKISFNEYVDCEFLLLLLLLYVIIVFWVWRKIKI
jgi:hypothetical protein